MIKNKNKNNNGAIMLVALALISFIFVISITSYKIASEQSLIANRTIMKEEAIQAAENAISSALQEFNYLVQEVGVDITELISKTNVKCIKNDVEIVLAEGVVECTVENGYANGDLVSQSTTKKKLNACIAWGSSDKIVECIEVIGKGYYFGSDVSVENVQDINFYNIKSQDSDIYEF